MFLEEKLKDSSQILDMIGRIVSILCAILSISYLRCSVNN